MAREVNFWKNAPWWRLQSGTVASTARRLLEKTSNILKSEINEVSLGIFSWAVLEPVEGEFHFEWMERSLTVCMKWYFYNSCHPDRSKTKMDGTEVSGGASCRRQSSQKSVWRKT